MKITKLLSLLLALALMLSFAACNNVTEDSETTADQAVENPTENANDDTTETTNAIESDTTGESETEGETDAPEYTVISIAEALELCGEPGNITTERYYIRAIVKSITNPQYGQMVITDGTNEIAVYGT